MTENDRKNAVQKTHLGGQIWSFKFREIFRPFFDEKFDMLTKVSTFTNILRSIKIVTKNLEVYSFSAML